MNPGYAWLFQNILMKWYNNQGPNVHWPMHFGGTNLLTTCTFFKVASYGNWLDLSEFWLSYVYDTLLLCSLKVVSRMCYIFIVWPMFRNKDVGRHKVGQKSCNLENEWCVKLAKLHIFTFLKAIKKQLLVRWFERLPLKNS